MPSPTTEPARAASASDAPPWVALVFVGLSLACLGLMSPKAVAVFTIELPSTCVVLLAAAGLGSIVARALLPREADRVWRGLTTLSLGLGGLSLLMLGGGALGIMGTTTWRGVLFGCIAAGAAWFLTGRGRRSATMADPPALRARGEPAFLPSGRADRVSRWFWLAAAPFAAMALLVATFPPGILWPAEGNGYDVLEYHFGAPRDWIDAGKITYLPHNIYSNFPMNAEMLYLLTMIVEGDAIDAACAAQLLNAALAMLAAGAVYLAAREAAPRFATLAAVIAASCPFVTYLCGVAYVENALVLFAAMGLAAMLRARRSPEGGAGWVVLSGFFAGLACGCKYTGVPAVLLPLALAAARPRKGAVRRGAAFVLPALLAFGPWLVRNAIHTGNPVFPLARSVMPERGGVWNDDGAARWSEGHQPAPEDRSAGRRLAAAAREIGASPLFGATVILIIPSGVVACASRRRPDADAARGSRDATILTPCWLMIAVGLLCWTAFTHLVGRFAVTLIPPAAVLTAAAGDRLLVGGRRRLALLAALSAVIVNAALLIEACTRGHVFELARFGAPGATQWFTGGQWPTHAHVPRVNELAARGSRVLVVADARRFYLDRGADYCVVFNNNPFAEAADEISPEQLLAWLRDRGYDHVLVNGGEMRRLRGSRYGFWKSIDEELFKRLEAAGLSRVAEFTLDGEAGAPPYATLFQIPPAPRP